MQTLWTKLTSAAEIFVYYEISREEVVLDKRANLARRLNSIKVKQQVKLWKQTLRYRTVRNKKSSLTGKNSFCKEAETVFSIG